METIAGSSTILVNEVLNREGQTLFSVRPVSLEESVVYPTSKEWPADEVLNEAAYLKCSNGQKIPLLRIEQCAASSSHLHFKI